MVRKLLYCTCNHTQLYTTASRWDWINHWIWIKTRFFWWLRYSLSNMIHRFWSLASKATTEPFNSHLNCFYPITCQLALHTHTQQKFQIALPLTYWLRFHLFSSLSLHFNRFHPILNCKFSAHINFLRNFCLFLFLDSFLNSCAETPEPPIIEGVQQGIFIDLSHPSKVNKVWIMNIRV